MSGSGALGRDGTIERLVAAARGRGAALLGPPGAGVSTVLRCVADRLRDEGRAVDLLRLPDDRDLASAADDHVVLVDDAHHGTTAQLRLLRDLALARPVIVAARSGAAPAYLAWLWRSGTVERFDLGDLDDGVIRAIVERRAGGPVHRTTLDAIVHRAAGRPGFAVDEIDALAADGRLTTRAGLLHGRVAGPVGSRLVERAADLVADLPADLRTAVERLAMSGRVPDSALAALDIDVPELARRQLLRTATGGDAAELHPPALAAAVRATLPPARALEVARTVSESVLYAVGPHDRARLLLLTGQHVELDDLATAVSAALRGGHRAEALNLARLAADRGHRGVVVEADVLAELGARAEAAQRYAVLVADETTPPELRAHAAMEHSVILMWDLARPDEAVATAAALANALDGSPFAAAARVHLASLTLYAGQPGVAATIIDSVDPAALDAATNAGRMLVGTVATALTRPGATDPNDIGRFIGQHPGGPFERGVFVTAVELAFELQGRYAEAADVAARGRARRPADETPASSAWGALAEARAELAIGRPAPAGRAAAESAALFDDINHLSGKRWAAGSAMLAAAMTGDEQATRRALDAFDRLDDGVPFLDADLRRARAWAVHTLGNSSLAAALLREAAAMAASTGAVALEAVALHDSFRLLGTVDRTRLNELARRASVPAIVLRARHVALVAAGEPADLLALSDEFEQLGALLIAAEVAGDAARAAASGGLRSVARTAIGHRVRLAALCGEPVTPRLADHRPVQLTTRERDVAVLAAHGRTSREIADELVVSVRTVDNMLQRVYVKLGVRGRGELAATMAAPISSVRR